MASQDPISRLAQQLGERLQGASQAPEEIHKGVQQVVRGAFDRLDLVSREDFDILMDVMQRTRIRVEALEQQVSALEAALASRQDEVTTSGEATTAGKAPKVDDGHPEEDAGGGEAGR